MEPHGRHPRISGSNWDAAVRAYHGDKLELAMSIAEQSGVGNLGTRLDTYRMIEAEALLRVNSVRTKVNDWLELEFLPGQVGASVDVLEQWAMGACEDVVDRFGWKHGPPVLLSLLLHESDVPWTPHRFGFHIAKNPYDKICLPGGLVRDPDEFRDAVRHEYAHVMVHHRTEGRCPVWLHEAVAMVAAEKPGPVAFARFATGTWPWLDPRSLDRAFRDDREDRSGQQRVWVAYQQAFAIGWHMKSLKGESGLGAVLDGFSDNGFFKSLTMAVKNQDPADEAVRQVFGVTQEQMFSMALSSL